jgi:hypothetical protein
MLSCVASWWFTWLKLAGDWTGWSPDLSSCEVGEFASQTGSLVEGFDVVYHHDKLQTPDRYHF